MPASARPAQSTMTMTRQSAVRFFLPVTLAALIGCAPLPGAESGALPVLDFDLLFGDNGTGRRPSELEWSTDGAELAFFFDDGEGKGLWVLDAESGETVLLGREDEGDMGKLDAYMTVAEAAEYLGVSPNTLRNWGRDGKIKERRHPLNSYRLYKKSELDRLISRIEASAPTGRRRPK